MRVTPLWGVVVFLSAGMWVDFNSAIFHQKFMICGNKVLTGSTNFTDTGVLDRLQGDQKWVIEMVWVSYIISLW
jgi:hypothetical protein